MIACLNFIPIYLWGNGSWKAIFWMLVIVSPSSFTAMLVIRSFADEAVKPDLEALRTFFTTPTEAE